MTFLAGKGHSKMGGNFLWNTAILHHALRDKITGSHWMHEALSSILLPSLFYLYMFKKSENRRRANCCEKSMPVVFYFNHDNECWIVASEHKNGNYSCRRNQTWNKEQFCKKNGVEHFWTTSEPMLEIQLQFLIPTFFPPAKLNCCLSGIF